MKKIFIAAVAFFFAVACVTKKVTPLDRTVSKSDTVRIANEKLDYEIIIIDPGFNGWLATYARPRNYYNQNFMQQRNQFWVLQWNQNVVSGLRPELFEMSINYDSSTDYGYEVDYLLFNYLTYIQLTNNIQLGGFNARL